MREYRMSGSIFMFVYVYKPVYVLCFRLNMKRAFPGLVFLWFCLLISEFN